MPRFVGNFTRKKRFTFFTDEPLSFYYLHFRGENTNTQSTGSEDNGDGQGSSQDDNLLEDWENNEGGSGLQYGEGWN